MMNIKIEPIDPLVPMSSPANVAELVNAVNGQNSNSSDGNQTSAIVENSSTSNGTAQTNGTTNGQTVVVSSASAANTIVVDKSRDLETTVISLAPAQPYPSGTLTFAPAYDLTGQYTLQVGFGSISRKTDWLADESTYGRLSA